MATIAIDTNISAIKNDTAVVTGLNPLPFAVTVTGVGDKKVFLTVKDKANSVTLASGLRMLYDGYTFYADVQPIIVHNLLTKISSGVRYELTVQAEQNGNVDTQAFEFYAVPETSQFGQDPQIGLYLDADLLTKLNADATCDTFVNKKVRVYKYEKSSMTLRRPSQQTWFNTTGTKSHNYGAVTWTINVLPSCGDDLILTFLNHKCQERQINLGRYYTERIEQGETMKVLRPYVNIYNSESDKYNLNVDGTRKIEITMRNVSREQMELLKDLYTSNCVKICKGATGNDIRVDVQMDAEIFNTKKPFIDVPMVFTLPKYYTI